MTRIMVTGGRTYGVLDPNKVLEHPLKRAQRRRFRVVMEGIFVERSVTEIIHGGAKGADFMAKEIAVEYGIKHTPFLADWSAYGLKAGPIRNQKMIDSKPDLVAAFPGGAGTADAVRRAREAGIEVLEIE